MLDDKDLTNCVTSLNSLINISDKSKHFYDLLPGIVSSPPSNNPVNWIGGMVFLSSFLGWGIEPHLESKPELPVWPFSHRNTQALTRFLDLSPYILHPNCWCMLVSQWRPTLCDSMGCSLPGSSVHGIFQARILEWVAILSSRVTGMHDFFPLRLILLSHSWDLAVYAIRCPISVRIKRWKPVKEDEHVLIRMLREDYHQFCCEYLWQRGTTRSPLVNKLMPREESHFPAPLTSRSRGEWGECHETCSCQWNMGKSDASYLWANEFKKGGCLPCNPFLRSISWTKRMPRL